MGVGNKSGSQVDSIGLLNNSKELYNKQCQFQDVGTGQSVLMSWRLVWAPQGKHWKTSQTMLHHTTVKIIWCVSRRDKGKPICMSNQCSLFDRIISLSIRLSFISEDFPCPSCHLWFAKYSFLAISLVILLYRFCYDDKELFGDFLPLTHSLPWQHLIFHSTCSGGNFVSIEKLPRVFDWVVRRGKKDR